MCSNILGQKISESIYEVIVSPKYELSLHEFILKFTFRLFIQCQEGGGNQTYF